MVLPIEKNGAILLEKVEEDGTKHVTIDYKGFQNDFEGKSELSYDEIEAYKSGVLIAIEQIFDMLPELNAKKGSINGQGFFQNKKYPCSLPKTECGKIIVISMNSNGQYVSIPIDSEDFSFYFNENKNVNY